MCILCGDFESYISCAILSYLVICVSLSFKKGRTEVVTEQCTCSAGQRRSEWCVWLAGGVFLQPHPPHSSEVAAPLDDAACEIRCQMLDVVGGQGSCMQESGTSE